MTIPQNPIKTVTYADIEAAAQCLKGIAHQTPVLTSTTVNRITGADVFFKCENFQRIGAFKFRGAYNALSQLSEAQKRQGVIAFSSGNHAQAIALSSQMLSIPATIVMPSDAPQVKQAATRGYGAEIVLYNRLETTREALTEQIMGDRNQFSFLLTTILTSLQDKAQRQKNSSNKLES